MDNLYEQFNPFKDNRTEQMTHLLKYYVPFSRLDAAAKPVVVEGGRGSGKTMLFQCNSWREILAQIKKSGKNAETIFSDYPFIGLYYRVDTTFVSSMRGESCEHWDALFETYLGICILQEVLDFIIEINDDMDIDESLINSFVGEFSALFDSSKRIETLRDFKKETERYLDSIEDTINGMSKSKIQDRRVQRLINRVCDAVGTMVDKEVKFKIFIDEYETLQVYQQKIINTLIKHSKNNVVFNIGMRPNGMRTQETFSDSETEIIEYPHDYGKITLDTEKIENYPQIIKDICRKRIASGKEQGKIPKTASENIEDYLGNYLAEDELNMLETTTKSFPYLAKLEHIIREKAAEENLSKEDIETIVAELCTNAKIMNSRLHYALLIGNTKNTPKVKDLYSAYMTKSRQYAEWVHNRKQGIIFLLCKEAKRDKMYYGFNAYTELSSNIVRYFLELCEQAFHFAFMNGFTWKEHISPEIQTAAARYVSEYKINDIAGYEPSGEKLRIFIQYLGMIFYTIHTDENSTVGEPEPNQFCTKDLSLSKGTKELLSSAVMWNVLQAVEPTKKKQGSYSSETVDFGINRIYVPYLGISYRRQRKIYLSTETLELLVSGDEKKAVRAFKQYFKYDINFDDDGDREGQISLFQNLE